MSGIVPSFHRFLASQASRACLAVKSSFTQATFVGTRLQFAALSEEFISAMFALKFHEHRVNGTPCID